MAMVKIVIAPQTDDIMITSIGSSLFVLGKIVSSFTRDNGVRDEVVLENKSSGISFKLFLTWSDCVLFHVPVWQAEALGNRDAEDDLPGEELKIITMLDKKKETILSLHWKDFMKNKLK